MGELNSQVGIKDKTLAEYVLSIAQKAPNVDAFGKQMMASGADFEQNLVNTIYAIVTRIFPPVGQSHQVTLEGFFEHAKKDAIDPLDADKMHQDNLVNRGDISDGAQSADDIFDQEKQKKIKGELTKEFPGLAQANKVVKDDQEIELDMDELDDALLKPQSAEKASLAKKERPRSRSRSRSRSASSNDSRRRRRRQKRDSRSPDHHRGSRRRHRRSRSNSDDSRRERNNRSASPRESRRHRRSRSASQEDSMKDRRRPKESTREESMHKIMKVGKIYKGSI